MGEAKRRRTKMGEAPCICLSSKPGRASCFDGWHWHKRPATLGLKALPKVVAVEKCYMKELGSCEGGISSEHLISESIILLLKADGDFTVSGLPWIPHGELKILGPKNLTANCLCRKHNSALSPLDAAAFKFVSALKSCMDREADNLRFIVSGHDIERWLLKTLKALAASGNLARDKERLSGAFSSDIRVLDMLDDPFHWPQGAGLYCMMRAGDRMLNHNRFQLAPHTNKVGELSGLSFNILGLDFYLTLQALDLSKNPLFARAVFRPGEIRVTYPAATNRISISWDDGKAHPEFLALKFERQVGA